MSAPEKVFYDGHGQYKYFTLHSNTIPSFRYFVKKKWNYYIFNVALFLIFPESALVQIMTSRKRQLVDHPKQRLYQN